MSWRIFLDVSAALILAGLFGCGLYETIAIINWRIPFTRNLPLITDIVRPWVYNHTALALGLAAIVVAAFFWLFFHFFLPARS
jgi:hypothetical protein